ncbi:hypothetical protein RU86_GL000008 [Lactococcus piscium]|uniref:GTP cyclohydrolase 1 type 2 homolog n=1 Tax=Pseudolactococcus piscium TaxID=1364 RepID=A0A2A5S5P8_9LACT|nr:Nif3-like dinuclear metal center hexameric protein [Lactococcus piscium]PCS08772.1 hypothetical protein RU86_GL000008 [Lactococcus piscium]
MIVSDVIAQVKALYTGIDQDGNKIDEHTTRDKVLFGDENIACTGIVVTCFASVAVIHQAIEQGANLIICHESMFWNRGNVGSVLEQNEIYKKKSALLAEHKIVVWRNHDFIHSGFNVDGNIVDGIFYGVMKSLAWDEFLIKKYDDHLNFKLPDYSVNEIAKHLIEKLNLNGLRIIGDPETRVRHIRIPFHILGFEYDLSLIMDMEEEKIDALIALEIIDFTVSEYIIDSSQLGRPKVVFSVGHFNLEEPGMAYLINYLPTSITEALDVSFVKSGDTFDYITK